MPIYSTFHDAFLTLLRYATKPGNVLSLLIAVISGISLFLVFRKFPKVDLKKKKIHYSLLIYILFAFMMIGIISAKTNYHVDEMYSYGLANSPSYIKIDEGTKFEPAQTVFLDYLTVDQENQFDYSIPYINQENDTHPPLYYILLHTVCSFFPERFSRWYAGFINIIFGLATLYLFRQLTLCFFCDEPVFRELLSIGFIFSVGILQCVSLFRMYVMAMFWVTCISYLYVSQIGKDINFKFVLLTFLIIVLGTLTHYYCIVYFVLISTVFGIYELLLKKWKDVIVFCISCIGGGSIAYLCFPAMIKHLLFGLRGHQSIENLTNINDCWDRLGSFYEFVNNQLFGGYLISIILLSLFFGLVMHKNDALNKGEKSKERVKYIFLLVPTALYFLFVSKSASFITDRYIFPIYCVLFLIIPGFFIRAVRTCFSYKSSIFITCVLVSFILVSSWNQSSWNYLYLRSEKLLKKVAQYADNDCICIYNREWQIQYTFLESKQYKSITFVQMDNEELLNQLVNNINQPVVLSLVGINNDKYGYVHKIIEKSEYLDNSSEIGVYTYNTEKGFYYDSASYYLSSN